MASSQILKGGVMANTEIDQDVVRGVLNTILEAELAGGVRNMWL